MDVGEVTAVHDVEDPCRNRGAEVAVQRRHRPRLDASLPSRPHHELIAFTKLLQERGQLPEVVGAVGVAHEDVLAANERERVDVGSAKPTARSPQHARSVLEGDLSGPIAPAVDDHDLAGDSRAGQTLPAPLDEVTNHGLFIESRDDDGDLGLGHIVIRQQQAHGWVRIESAASDCAAVALNGGGLQALNHGFYIGAHCCRRPGRYAEVFLMSPAGPSLLKSLAPLAKTFRDAVVSATGPSPL